MVKEFYQDSQMFVTREFFIEIAVCFFCFGETAKFLCRFFHDENINLAAVLSERI
jgi:hypothetical protein